jgi:hypothetical protein
LKVPARKPRVEREASNFGALQRLLSRAGLEMTNMGEPPSRTLKQKAYQGLKEYLAISCYLWLVFGLFVVYRSVLMSEQHVSFVAHGEALLNALALGKIMLIAQELHFAERFKGKPLIYPTLFKSAAFAVDLGCFKIVEEICIGLLHGKSAGQSIAEVAGGTLNGIIAMMAILAVLLIPFFAFTELRSILGKEQLAGLFFTTGRLPSESS